MMSNPPTSKKNFTESFGPITQKPPSKKFIQQPNSIFKNGANNNSFLNNTSLFMPKQSELDPQKLFPGLQQARLASFDSKGLGNLMNNHRPSFKTLGQSYGLLESNLFGPQDRLGIIKRGNVSKNGTQNNLKNVTENLSGNGFSQLFGKEIGMMSKNSLNQKEDSIFKMTSGVFKSNEVLEMPDMFKRESSQALCNNSFGKFCGKNQSGFRVFKEEKKAECHLKTKSSCNKACSKKNGCSKKIQSPKPSKVCYDCNETPNKSCSRAKAKPQACNNQNCSWETKHKEDPEIHMMRLKSRHSDKGDVYIVTCCLNPNFINKVLSKINGFCNKSLKQKFDVQLCKDAKSENKQSIENRNQIIRPKINGVQTSFKIKQNRIIKESPALKFFKEKSLIDLEDNQNFMKSIRKLNEVLMKRIPSNNSRKSPSESRRNVPNSLLNISEEPPVKQIQLGKEKLRLESIKDCRENAKVGSIRKQDPFKFDSSEFKSREDRVTPKDSPNDRGYSGLKSIQFKSGADLLTLQHGRSKNTLESELSHYKNSQPALLSLETQNEIQAKRLIGKRGELETNFPDLNQPELKRLKREKENDKVKTLNFRLPSFHSQLRNFTDSQLVINENDSTRINQQSNHLNRTQNKIFPKHTLQQRDLNLNCCDEPKTQSQQTQIANPTFLPDSILKNQTKPPQLLENSKKKQKNIVKPNQRTSKSKKKLGENCCKCAKSLCLKLYCQCFASGRGCGPECQCINCHNTDEFKELRELVVLDTKEKNPEAFNSKYKQRKKGKGEIVHSRGCNCKTGCNKKYCECHAAGTGCSELCKCVNCENHKIAIKKEEVPKLFVKVLRKRKRRNILGEYLKLQGKITYKEFIERTKKQISNQKRRKRKTSTKKQKALPIKIDQSRPPAKTLPLHFKEEEENVFIESTLMEDPGVKVELSK